MKIKDISELVMDLHIDYYLKIQNQLLGPVSWLEIVHLYDLQTINQNDFYSCSVNGPWIRFFEFNLVEKTNTLPVLANPVKTPPKLPNKLPKSNPLLSFGLLVTHKIMDLFHTKTSLIFSGIFVCLLIVFYCGSMALFNIIPSSDNTLGDVISPLRNYGKEWGKIDLGSIEKMGNQYFVDIECWNDNIFFVKTFQNEILKFDSLKWTTVFKSDRNASNFIVTGPNTLVTSIGNYGKVDWVLVNDKDANKEIPFKEKNSSIYNWSLTKINKDTYKINEGNGSAQILKNGQPFFSRMQESDITKDGFWNKSYYDLLKIVLKKEQDFSNYNLLWMYHTPDFKLNSLIFLEDDKVRIAASQANSSETILIDKFQRKIMKGWGNSDKLFWIVNDQGTVWKRENSKMVPITNPPNGNNSFVDFSITRSGKVYGITRSSIFYLD